MYCFFAWKNCFMKGYLEYFKRSQHQLLSSHGLSLWPCNNHLFQQFFSLSEKSILDLPSDVTVLRYSYKNGVLVKKWINFCIVLYSGNSGTSDLSNAATVWRSLRSPCINKIVLSSRVTLLSSWSLAES